MSYFKSAFVSLVIFAAAAQRGNAQGFSQNAHEAMEAGFRNPPAQAKPHTWWHWMNGNVTRKGITADLEAMKQIGLGGAQIFNVSESIPDGPIGYNSDEWRGLVKFAAQEAQRLGLELCIHNCAGWSSSGGPWVKPEYAMQTVVFSEVKVKGPAPFTAELAQPKANAGYYQDIAVIAFPTPKDDATRIKDYRSKALYDYTYGQQPSLEKVSSDAIIKRTDMIDLSANLVNGKLNWEVPAGEWTVLRIGHTATGAVNAPSPVSGRGLEVDKMSREAFDQFWAGGMAPLIKELGPLAGKVLNNVLVDSYEMGCQNWTPKFREEFKKRRGYDLLMYLPTMTGRYVESGEASERFLVDLRRTVSDLFKDNYYTYFAEVCKKNGLLSSVEPYDGPFECTQVGKDADIVMGEFWVTAGMSNSCKLAADVAHVYGKKIVGAESFTAEPNVGKWMNHPASVKAVGDLMYSTGINRYIIHRYAHQPWSNVVPGMTMGQWGTHFERTTTWWEQGSAWISYLARCQYLLQEGKFVADVLFYAGEAAPNTPQFETVLKVKGYDYDACGSDVVLNSMSVKDGMIVLASGMSYRVLVLPETTFMTPRVADKLRELVNAGATVIGPKPVASPSASGQPAADIEVAKIGAELWGTCDGKTVKENPSGKGRIVWGKSIDEVLAGMKVAPDCMFRRIAGGKATMAWIHRVIDGADVYFFANQKPRSEELECAFRVSGKSPQLWHAETGVIEPAPVWREKGGYTVLPMRLEANESVFVVFSGDSKAPHLASVTPPPAYEIVRQLPKIVITKARYEAVDGAGGADVKAKVAELISSGEFAIPATNGVFGDPTSLHVKRLVVDYTLDGKPMTRSVAENETLVLLDTSIPEVPAAYRVAVVGAGLELQAFKAGTYATSHASGKTTEIQIASVPDPLEISGAWNVKFQSGRGAPETAKFDSLASWSENADNGVKYFSGSAVYEKEFDVSADAIGTGKVARLSLGSVKEIAEVTLNGTSLGVWWKAPFEGDVTGILKAGKNTLQIRVTNLWVNRLIGDEQLPEDMEWNGKPIKKWPAWFDAASEYPLKSRTSKDRLTFTTWHHWYKDSPLMESGLIGPVRVRVGVTAKVE